MVLNTVDPKQKTESILLPTQGTDAAHELCASARRGIARFEGGDVTAAQLATGLRKLADMLDPPVEAIDQKAVRTVYEAWLRELGKDPRKTKLTKDRKVKIQARLREGYSVEDMLLAVRNCAASPFHRGENDRGIAFDDLTLICRNGSKLESFRDLGLVADSAAQPPIQQSIPPQTSAPAARYKDAGF